MFERAANWRWFVAMLVMGGALALPVARSQAAGDAAAPADAGHGAAAHGGESHGSTDPLTIDMDLALWTLVVFVLLLKVLQKFAWGPIIGALDKREQTVASDLHSAHHANHEAKKLLAEYEAKLSAAHDEVRALVEQGRKEGLRLQEELLAKGRSEAAAEMERAKREIGLARDAAVQELATSAANLAVDLAGKIVCSSLNPADHATLVREAVDKFASRN